MVRGDLDNIPTYFATGTSRAITSNHISYYFDWHGPSMTVDTACSSSLVALHHAVQSLRLGECKMAVAGGVNLLLGPGKLFQALSTLGKPLVVFLGDFRGAIKLEANY